MHELHVKIDNQAFMFIHVVGQVQLFKREQPILIASPSESEIVRGEKVVPMRRTILTRLVNSEVRRIEKMSEIHVWRRWRSLVCCVSVCAIGLHVLFQSAVGFWWMRRQSFESYYMQQNRENTCREMWSCVGMHQNMNAPLCGDVLPDTRVYYLAGVGERA